MAKSFFDYLDNGFWVDDPTLEEASALFFIFIQDDRRYFNEMWYEEFLELLKLNAEYGFGGFGSWDLEKYIDDSNKKKWIIDKLKSIILEIQNNLKFNLSYIDENSLNSSRGDSWVGRGGSNLEFKTSMIEFYEKVINLLQYS